MLTYVEHYIMATVTLELSRDLRRDLSRKINVVPMSYFNTVSYGDVLSRVTNDVSTLQQAIANSLPSMISLSLIHISQNRSSRRSNRLSAGAACPS